MRYQGIKLKVSINAEYELPLRLGEGMLKICSFEFSGKGRIRGNLAELVASSKEELAEELKGSGTLPLVPALLRLSDAPECPYGVPSELVLQPAAPDALLELLAGFPRDSPFAVLTEGNGELEASVKGEMHIILYFGEDVPDKVLVGTVALTELDYKYGRVNAAFRGMYPSLAVKRLSYVIG